LTNFLFINAKSIIANNIIWNLETLAKFAAKQDMNGFFCCYIQLYAITYEKKTCDLEKEFFEIWENLSHLFQTKLLSYLEILLPS
jgi:hypothetical protein